MYVLCSLGRARVLLFACIAVLLPQCAMVNGSIDSRFEQINRSSAYARNQSILLNIVRASHNDPLNFVAAARITGSTQAQMGGGLPSFLLGPYPIATGAPFATNLAGNTFNIVEPTLTRNVILNNNTLNASTKPPIRLTSPYLDRMISIRPCSARSICPR